MNRIAEKIFGFVFKYRAAAVAVFLLLTAFMGYRARTVTIDNALDIWFVKGDPALENYRHYQDVFGSDERVAVVVESAAGMDGIKSMDYLERLNTELRSMEYIEHTVSPTHFKGAKMPEFLFSKDKKSAVIIADMGIRDNMDEVRSKGVENIKKAIEATRAEGFRVSIAGAGVVFDELNKIAGMDFPVLTGLSYAIIITVLFFVTRSAYIITFAVAAFTASIIWLLGIMGSLHMYINMVSMAAPSIVLIIAVENFGHINSHLTSGAGNFSALTREDIVKRLSDTFVPSFIAMATTVVGFLSLTLTKMRIIQEFGLITALGTIAAFFCTYFVMLLSYTARAGKDAKIPRPDRPRDNAEFAQKIIKYKFAIVISTALLFGAAVYGIVLLKSDTNSMNYLKKSNAVRQDSEHIEKVFGFYMPLDIVLKSKKDLKKELLTNPGFMEKMRKFESAVSRIEGVRAGFSLKDVVPLLAGGKIPGHESAIKYILSDDGKETKAVFQVKMTGSQGIKNIIEEIKRAGAANLGGELEVIPAGYLPLYVKMMEYMEQTQKQSFSAAFLVIFLVIGFSLKSARYALLSIFPNLFPIAVVIGVMGYMGVSLDVATVTIASIAIGIVVDDTVHFLYNYKNNSLKKAAEKLAYTFNRTFSAVSVTSLVLGLGFMVFVFSHVKSLIYFGLFTGIIIFIGWLADILIMPAILAIRGDEKE